MAALRTLVLFVIALAVAVAPAAPCTMAHAAAAHRHGDHAKPAVSPEAGRHVHHHVASRPSATLDDAVASERGSPPIDLTAARSTSQESGCPEHRQRAHKGPCPAACCTLAGQAALPTATWSGACLDVHSSDRVLIAQEDGVVDAHPPRIERPPRRGA